MLLRARICLVAGLLALAAGVTPAWAAPSGIESTAPQPQIGPSPFAPPTQPSLAQPAPTDTEPTQIDSSRPDEGGLGDNTMLLLLGVSVLLILGVGGLIWYEGREGRSAARKRRKRLRAAGASARPQPATAGRRGPPPPPRKRRAAAKKKKR